MTTTRKLTLVGEYAGKTVNLRGHLFKNGSLTVSGSGSDVESLSSYLRRCYQAYPDPSEELDTARKVTGDVGRGGNEVHQNRKDAGNRKSGDAGPTSPRTSQRAATENRKGTPDASARSSGSKDVVGNRYQTIIEALKGLDPENDDHWTDEGKPKISALEVLLGRTDLTRAEVSGADPNFSREVALAE